MSAVWAPQVPTHADQHSGVIAEHVTAVFTVSRVARFEVAVPKPGVYGAIDYAGLRLISCGGTYDPAGQSAWTTSLSSPGWRRYAGLVAENPTRSALDHYHKGFGRHAGVGV